MYGCVVQGPIGMPIGPCTMMMTMMIIFRSGGQAFSVRAEVQTLEKAQHAKLRTLGVLHSLLGVEGQGAHPRASGIRKQVPPPPLLPP